MPVPPLVRFPMEITGTGSFVRFRIPEPKGQQVEFQPDPDEASASGTRNARKTAAPTLSVCAGEDFFSVQATPLRRRASGRSNPGAVRSASVRASRARRDPPESIVKQAGGFRRPARRDRCTTKPHALGLGQRRNVALVVHSAATKSAGTPCASGWKTDWPPHGASEPPTNATSAAA